MLVLLVQLLALLLALLLVLLLVLLLLLVASPGTASQCYSPGALGLRARKVLFISAGTFKAKSAG